MNDTPVVTATYASLSRSALHSALRAAGHTPGWALADILGPAAEGGAGTEPGWPDAAFRSTVLGALSKPPVGRARVFGMDRIEQIAAFRSPSGEELCLSALPGQETVTLSAPLPARAAGIGILELLAPTEAAPRRPLRFEVPTSALMAFAACLDHFRLSYAASLVRRAPMHSFSMTLDDIERQMADGAGFEDYRWMCPLVGRMVSGLAASARHSLPGDAGSLCSAGHLVYVGAPDGAYFEPSGPMIQLALDLVRSGPAVLLEGRKGMQLIVKGNALWLVELQGEMATLSGIDGLDAMMCVQTVFGESPP
jgi:hypothetical protein